MKSVSPARTPSFSITSESAARTDGRRERLAGGAPLHASHDRRAGIGFEEVPGLGLAETAPLPRALSLRIVGVHLHRQPVRAVEQLDQERKACAVTGRCVGAEKRRTVVGGHGRYGLPGVFAGFDAAFVKGAPHFADLAASAV